MARGGWVLIAALIVGGCNAPSSPPAPTIADSIKHELSSPSDAPAPAQTLRADLQRFYEGREFKPAWVEESKVDGATRALEVLATAPEHGLGSIDYGANALAALIESARSEPPEQAARTDTLAALAALDLKVTETLLAFGEDVAVGTIKPTRIDRAWKSQRKSPDLVAALAASADDLPAWIDRIQPQHPEYAALRSALRSLLSAGAQGEGPEAAHAGQLALNLERWRWLPDDLGARHIIVNVPAYELRIRENGATVQRMRVVVGEKGAQRTPIFSDEMETVVFSPYWNVPHNIGQKETLEAMLNEFSSLERNGMEILKPTSKGRVVVDPLSIDWYDEKLVKQLTFRQKPGPLNALGKVKFLFPNEYDVYLHDTPGKSAFSGAARALSHGCVRVADPEALARYVLREAPAWTDSRIAAAMAAGKEQHVRLPAKIPVHLVYFTAWTDESGAVHYEPDIYGHDAKQRAATRLTKDS